MVMLIAILFFHLFFSIPLFTLLLI